MWQGAASWPRVASSQRRFQDCPLLMFRLLTAGFGVATLLAKVKATEQVRRIRNTGI